MLMWQVRAAVPMYLLSRKIKAGGFKVVLSGEGADEIYGGYLFFHKAPSPAEFQQCAPLASPLHDVLTSDSRAVPVPGPAPRPQEPHANFVLGAGPGCLLL